MERIAFVSDDHAPFQDEKTYLCRLDIIRYLKPDVLFLGGDHCDFYQLSKFDQRPERITKLQDDLDETYALIRGYREAAGKQARVFYLEGNHEERLAKFLMRNAAALYGLKVLSVPNLLGLEKLKIEYVVGGAKEYRGVVFKHGNMASQKSGYTAHREMDTWWHSGVSGHTHRLAMIWKTTAVGDVFWTEAGCGCQKLEYVKGRPADWQQGAFIGFCDTVKKLWTPQVVKITNGSAIVDQREPAA